MSVVSLPKPEQVSRVAIVGAGTIGASWAAHFLRRGMTVQAWDPAPGAQLRLRQFVDNAWPALARLGLGEGAAPDRLHWCESVAAAVDGVQFVQESAPERMETKIALYETFDSVLPEDAVMSTSSSGLLLSDLQSGRRGRSRYVLGHPFNPPHLIPLVEVLGGKDTDPGTVDWALDFYNAHGKRAIRLNKEVPGHLVNRLQAALWREAVAAVDDGLASVEDVDAAIAYGPGLRWALMGPHLVFHLAGRPGGMRNFLEHFGPPMESWWADMRDVELDDRVKRKLVDGIEAEARGRDVSQLERERDALLLDVLETLARSRERFTRE